jgi:hypothetical protein
MKAIILILFIGLTLTISSFLVCFAPYHFYNTSVNSGMNSRFFTIGDTSKTIHEGSYYSIKKMEGVSSESKDLWESFHFGNFVLPLPVRHPILELIPVIERRKSTPVLGARFDVRNKSAIFDFKVLESYKFNRKIKHHKIFELPFFKNYLLAIEDRVLWKDLFTKNLNLPQGSFTSESYWKSLWRISYKELVYNLYLLLLREEFFPDNARSIAYYSNKSFGVIELIDVDKEALGLEGVFRTEMVFVFDKGFIHKFKISSKFEDYISESIRVKFLNALTYKSSDESSSIEIYARYKNLPYYKRITQEGLTYLFAAWSHVTDKKEYLKEMIQFLERGKTRSEVLKPLYDYSFKKFGTNFSILRNNLKESAKEKLKRKIIEEEAAELKRLEDIDKNTAEVEGEFETEDDKVKYFLKKAKESETTNEDENILYKD